MPNSYMEFSSQNTSETSHASYIGTTERISVIILIEDMQLHLKIRWIMIIIDISLHMGRT